MAPVALPSTQECLHRDIRAFAITEEEEKTHEAMMVFPIYQQAIDVARYVVSKRLNADRKLKHTALGEKMYSLCKTAELKHELFFKGIGARLNLDRATFRETFVGVIQELFRDKANFGRFVSLYTFCIVIAEYCEQNDMSDLVESSVRITAESVYAQRGWLLQHDNFVSSHNLFLSW